MSDALFPLVFANEEVRLLTAIGLGFLFGFSLERAGFGNARKLAAQFYLRDMTVFKVMFTAILVTMVGLYSLAALGLVDMARIWINPTFMWGQVVGGFLLGVGFIMSGLCPGTSVVSAASGRWDGLVTLAGVFAGTLAFTLVVGWFPAVESLYEAGSMGVSLLPEVLGLPPLVFAGLVVVMAAAAFVGAEKVEAAFAGRGPALEHAPRPLRRVRPALVAALVVVLAAGYGFRPAPTPAACPLLEEVEPLALAERVVAGDPTLIILDVRADGDLVPGAFRAGLDSTALPVLAAAGETSLVVVVDGDGTLRQLPAFWPGTPAYALLRGGWAAWEAEVRTPATTDSWNVAERERVARQNALAAFFSGAVITAPAAAPPPIPTGGGGAKPKRGGC